MVPAAFVVLDALPLTPNGKVDREALPAPEGERQLEQAYVAPRTQNEIALAKIWQEVLRVDRVGIHDNFFDLGGDSILGIQVVSRASAAGIRFEPRQLFQNQKISELAAVVAPAAQTHVQQEPMRGPVPLTPIQHWFFEHNVREPHHFNHALLLKVRRPLAPALWREAVLRLFEHHDALRLRFVRDGISWKQSYDEVHDNAPFTHVDLSDVPMSQQSQAIEARASEVQRSLNLSSGPLVRMVHFTLGPNRCDRILVVVHHLVIDGVSWRILLEDLKQVSEQLRLGQSVELPPKTTSFQQWSTQLVSYAKSEAVSEQSEYWGRLGSCGVVDLPVDYPSAHNSRESARQITSHLDVEQTQALLRDVPTVYRTQINDVLIAALVQALNLWTGYPKVFLDVESHGREDLFQGVDLTRTIGWFTSMYPLFFEVTDPSDPAATLKEVKEELRSVPNNGIGYGLLRYLQPQGSVAAKVKTWPTPQVSFNYLGQFDQVLGTESLFSWASEPIGTTMSPLESRSHLLEVGGRVVSGRLQIAWIYSTNIHRRDTIKHLARSFMDALKSLINHCLSEKATICTPGDFPLAGLDEQELRTLSELVDRADGTG
jgi:non-ribosomal peptide synthase protein (TIGR01720 family)